MKNMESNEGWSVDVTNKKATHYYKDGKSLCGKELQKHHMNIFDKSIDYSQVLGYRCTICYNRLKKMRGKIYESQNFPQPECSVCSGTGKVLQAAKEKQKDLKDKLFNLANEFAIAEKGDIAVLLHSIHNKLP
jgi:hypothetical protein